jgi:hypothetical protein
MPSLSKIFSRSSFSSSMRFWTTPVAMLLLNATIPCAPVAAVYRNDYQLCARQLVRLRISPETAADACAATIYPKDLTVCVYKINQQTNIAAVDALSTCRQVRRPRDLATCTINITNKTQGSDSAAVMDNCRRSLLPVRFSECVVGLNRETNFSVRQAMASCIDGSDRPRDFYPPVSLPQNF